MDYYHDENGYSDIEWKDIAEIIASPPNLFAHLSLNQHLRLPTLRQNCGFLRVSHPEFLGYDIVSERTTCHNIDDNVGTLAGRLEMGLGKCLIGFYVTSVYDKDEAEFKLRSPNRSIMAYYSISF